MYGPAVEFVYLKAEAADINPFLLDSQHERWRAARDAAALRQFAADIEVIGWSAARIRHGNVAVVAEVIAEWTAGTPSLDHELAWSEYAANTRLETADALAVL